MDTPSASHVHQRPPQFPNIPCIPTHCWITYTRARVHEKDFVDETGQLQAEYPNIKGDGTSLLCDTLGLLHTHANGC